MLYNDFTSTTLKHSYLGAGNLWREHRILSFDRVRDNLQWRREKEDKTFTKDYELTASVCC